MSGTLWICSSWLVVAFVAMVDLNACLEESCRLFKRMEFLERICFRRNGDTRKDDLDDNDGNENRKRGPAMSCLLESLLDCCGRFSFLPMCVEVLIRVLSDRGYFLGSAIYPFINRGWHSSCQMWRKKNVRCCDSIIVGL